MNVQTLNIHSVAPGPHTSSERGVQVLMRTVIRCDVTSIQGSYVASSEQIVVESC